jgi:lincosamide nucleotidyltransferase A/C/D/E
MQKQEVIDFYNQLKNIGIKIWIDGGWGVDALLGKQTRPHKDLDIAIQQKDIPKFKELMERQGYKDTKSEDARPHNFILSDDLGHKIDVHVIVLDDKGNGIYGPIENVEIYPSASLTGSGTIGGQKVRCISPEWMIKFHSGYELKKKDFQDISALCEKFGINLPEEYQNFKN